MRYENSLKFKFQCPQSGTQPHSFICILSRAAYTPQWQSQVVATETVWPAKPIIFTIWPLQRIVWDTAR